MKTIGLYLMNKKGLKVLESIISTNKKSNIVYVVGSKDKNVVKDYFEEIKSLCEINGIKFVDKNKPLNFNVDYKIAVGWRWMIHDEYEKLIIFHDSLLPKYRGFAPLVNCLINGEKKIGVTALFAASEYDKGNIIEQISMDINYPIKISSAIEKISELYQEIVTLVLKKIEEGLVLGFKQDESKASYSLWRDKKDYFVNWNWSSVKIKRFIDAVGYPFEGARSKMNDQDILILDVEIEGDLMIKNRDVGKVIFMNNGDPIVVCDKGLLRITSMTDLKGNKIKLKKFRTRFN